MYIAEAFPIQRSSVLFIIASVLEVCMGTYRFFCKQCIYIHVMDIYGDLQRRNFSSNG